MLVCDVLRIPLNYQRLPAATGCSTNAAIAPHEKSISVAVQVVFDLSGFLTSVICPAALLSKRWLY